MRKFSTSHEEFYNSVNLCKETHGDWLQLARFLSFLKVNFDLLSRLLQLYPPSSTKFNLAKSTNHV